MAESFDKDNKDTVLSDMLSAVGLVFYFIAITFIVFVFLNGLGALENPDNVQKFWTYGVLGAVSVIFVIVAKGENFIRIYTKAGRRLEKGTRNLLEAIDIFIHQPRYSLITDLLDKKQWWLNPFDLTIIFLILGLLIGLLSIIFQAGIGRIYSYLFEQQISPTAEFGLAIEPAVFGETMFLMIIMGLLWGVSKYAVIKRWFNGLYNKTVHFFFTLFVFPIIGGFVWMGVHFVVYGGYTRGLATTWAWGWLQSFTGMLFVSIIPPYILHATNNAFLKAQELFATEITAIVVFALIILLASLFAVRVSIFARRTQ